ncbi:hypothetical protein [Thiopseudomonas acetoxidans]|uniref:Uncharacterized protein n=1 Tax=Thiopseudomonas acetoxidans TaxID=3041622 RepID=A0ABT7SRZ7_9GAMM|nr:hypothetical protein [Thiopseudomonas sp. CY1220]MDM7858963.1 hypothetical protein [Thiopseudomonas sp. CY1220]
MRTVTCSNEECGADIEFGLEQLEIEDSQPFGSHTTQHSSSGAVVCENCNSATDVRCVWDELNDTGEILSIDFI